MSSSLLFKNKINPENHFAKNSQNQFRVSCQNKASGFYSYSEALQGFSYFFASLKRYKLP
ncbi:hypothetical protein D5R89_03990 [Vibrio cholerae]|nr:hypothetical protein D5R89_03990 [Vibrio cholerae]